MLEGKNRLFIFGAGASVSYGGPLMRDFLSRAMFLTRRVADDDYSQAVKMLLKVRNNLQNAYASSAVDLENVEEILTLLEMHNELGRPIFKDLDSREVLDRARFVVARTVEEQVRIPCAPSGDIFKKDQINRNDAYRLLIRHLKERDQLRESVFLTFNYDLALDAALLSEDAEICYHPDQDHFCGTNWLRVPVLKLHGSTNWGTCGCGEPCIRHLNDFRHRVTNEGHPNQTRTVKMTDARHGYAESVGVVKHEKSEKCAPYTSAYVMAPSWYKMPRTGFTRRMWQLVADAINQAQHLTIIGYSWPETDKFFQQLFTVGRLYADFAESFFIVNPEAKNEDMSKMFGGQLKQRLRLIPKTFQDALEGQDFLDGKVADVHIHSGIVRPTSRPDGRT